MPGWMVNLSQSAEGHQVLVLYTEEMAEVSSGSQMLLCAGKPLPAAEGLAWCHHGSGRPVYLAFSCLVKVMFGPALQLPLWSSTANTPRPVAAPGRQKGETYLLLFTEQGTLQLLSNAGLCSMLVWILGLAKT